VSCAHKGFAKQYRLLGSAEFRRVFKARNKISGPVAALYLAANDKAYSRLGITVSKKVSKKAVERNRIKRLAREYFRTQRESLPGQDIVFNAFPGCAELDNRQLRQTLDKLWRRARKRCER